MVYKLLPKTCLLCKVRYANHKDLVLWLIFYITIVYNLMYYSNKHQLFCTCVQSTGGKLGSIVCELLLKPVNNDSYDETQDLVKIDLCEDNG